MFKNSASQQIRIWQTHKHANAQHVVIVKIPFFKFVLYPWCPVDAIVFSIAAVILAAPFGRSLSILRHYHSSCHIFDVIALFLVDTITLQNQIFEVHKCTHTCYGF